MVIAVFPGSFDPPSRGHVNIIERASRIFDQLVVLVAVNTAKESFLSADERVELLEELVKPFSNVTVARHSGLVVDYVHSIKGSVIVRGVRALSDFNYEFELSMLNKSLAQDIETVFLPTDPEFFVLRSSAIKELLAFKGDISHMVPRPVAEKLLAKMKESGNT